MLKKALSLLGRAKHNVSGLRKSILSNKLYKRLVAYTPSKKQRVFGLSIVHVALITVFSYVIITGLASFWIYRGNTNILTRFAERIAPYPAAFAGNSVISLSRYRSEVAARITYAEVHNLQTSREDIASFVMNQLIDRQLYLDVLDRSDQKLNQSDVEAKLNEIRDQVEGDDKLRAFLKDNYGPDVDIATFRRWLTEAGYESLLQSNVLERVKIRHILVALPKISTDEQREAARQKALTIKAGITSPEQFGPAARQFSEDIVSRDRDGEFGTTNRGDAEPVISADFENAIFSLPVNTVSEPVLSQYGWHLILVEEKTGTVQLSKKAFTEQLRADSGVRILIPLK